VPGVAALRRLRQKNPLSLVVQDHPGQHSKTIRKKGRKRERVGEGRGQRGRKEKRKEKIKEKMFIWGKFKL
jgi:hypothetical protein